MTPRIQHNFSLVAVASAIALLACANVNANANAAMCNTGISCLTPSQDQASALLARIEQKYPQYFSPSGTTQVTTIGSETAYYRMYSSVAGVGLATFQGGLWYAVNSQWYRFSSLDESNSVFCNSGCWGVSNSNGNGSGSGSAIPITYQIVDTGQVTTFDTTTSITAPATGQPFYGQDAQYNDTQPSYTKSSDGLTVKDNITGLTWQANQTGGDIYWTEAQSIPTALNQSNYGGYSDWRLPTIKELYSIWNGSTGWPYVDTHYFSVPYTSEQELSHAIVWSSTQYTGLMRSTIDPNKGAELAFGVNFGTGHIKAYSTSVGPKHMVRAVRGAIYGANNFVDNKNGTISDQATGLMWSQTDSGVGMDWQNALAWTQTKNSEQFLGYSDWRLPNTKELQSLVDYTRSAEATLPANVGAAINPLFKTTSITNEAGVTDYPYFWTSTSARGSSSAPFNSAWYVAFGRAVDSSGYDLHGAGAIRFDAKIRGEQQGQDAERVYNYVRLVRTTISY